VSVTKLRIELIDANEPALFSAEHVCVTELSPLEAIDRFQKPLSAHAKAFVPPGLYVPKLPLVFVRLTSSVSPGDGIVPESAPVGDDALITAPVSFAKNVLLPAVNCTRARSVLLLFVIVILPVDME
jgi:hypothetical protein